MRPEKPCTCHQCVNACETRPCWPNPAEAAKLLDMGLGPKLWLDYWSGEHDIEIVAPSAEGYGGGRAAFWPTGRCMLLTPEGRCSVHDTCKPEEGARSSCEPSGEGGIELHREVALKWDTDEGRAVVERFRREVMER